MKNKYLTEKERYVIEKMLKKNIPVKEIAESIGKHKSTVYREIKRGEVLQKDSLLKEKSVYLADVGERKKRESGLKKGRKEIFTDEETIRKIEDKLFEKRSPYAISIILNDEGITISEKTIYNYIHKKKFEKYKECHMIYQTKRKKKINDKRLARNHGLHTSIEERDKEISKREEFGHWEMDSVESGKGDKTSLIVMTERKTRMELIFKVHEKSAESTLKVLRYIERFVSPKIFREIFKSITVDNGSEFANQEGMENSNRNKLLKRTKIYYCHPYCSSERGSNENQNRIIRRFIPKGDLIKLYSEEDIKEIVKFINGYPRRMYEGKSSEEIAMKEENAESIRKLMLLKNEIK